MFLRLLGVVYLVAFASLWTQVHGLVGEQGILPASDFLARAGAQLGAARLWQLPTLGWWTGAGDAALSGMCAAGVAAAVALVLGVLPALMLVLLWALYLSLTVLGQDFLSFQWDVLLLEVGFLALFVTPGTPPWPRRLGALLLPDAGTAQPPPRAGVWLLRWTLFRFMLMSGWVKLGSGDPTWHDLTALQYHFETQPLTTWTGWYVHQLPDGILQVLCGLMFCIELVVPFFVFANRRMRHLACALLVLLQLVIAATGNYTFFNLLTVVLCVPLLDDNALRRLLPRRWITEPAQPVAPAATTRTRVRVLLRTAYVSVAALVFVIGALVTARTLGLLNPLPGPARALVAWVAPLRTLNSYGLFAVMTTERPEIILEGSNDGVEWRPYRFKYKPGEPGQRPGFVAPHQPRLDWQMWFAALRGYRGTRWFPLFMQRVLEGSPPVLALLDDNPFPERPPRYLRAMLYDYRFTAAATRSQTGNWWTRELLGAYSPVFSLPDR